ncbi:MAG TPA: hypothetical protein V6C88_12160 [Chroococcidiopsis sp.]
MGIRVGVKAATTVAIKVATKVGLGLFAIAALGCVRSPALSPEANPPEATAPVTAPVTAPIRPTVPPETRQALTPDDAAALISQVVEAINRDDTAFLLTYLKDTRPDLISYEAAIAHYKTIFHNQPITQVELIDHQDQGLWLGQPAQTFTYEIRNDRGDRKTIRINQERGLVRVLDECLLYSHYAEAQIQRLLASIAANDAPQLAALLSVDDVDYAMEPATQAIATYRAQFDPGTLRYRFEGLDNDTFFRYTLYGTKAGQPVEHSVTVVHGDGLVGLRDSNIPQR